MSTRGAEIAGPGPKADDRAGEEANRRQALADVRAAIGVEADARTLAAAVSAERAERAAWLGASLADLAAVTGHSRQAARKRWPSLGDVSRRRTWLGNHVDEVLWAVRLVLDAELDTDLDADRAALARALAEVEEAFAAELAAEFAVEEAVARWRALDALVDEHLRAVVTAAGDDDAFPVHGARGVLAYYDHATG